MIISLPLLLPIEFGMLTSMPRGFVTGIFASTFLIPAAFYHGKRYLYILTGFFAVFSLILNPASIIFLLPLIVYLTFQNHRDKNFYLFSIIGSVSAFLIYFSIQYFYKIYPNYIYHNQMILDFSINRLLSSFNSLDKFFNNVVPIFWGMGR